MRLLQALSDNWWVYNLAEAENETTWTATHYFENSQVWNLVLRI